MKALTEPDNAKPSTYVGHTVLWKDKIYKVIDYEPSPPIIVMRKGLIKTAVTTQEVEVLRD